VTSLLQLRFRSALTHWQEQDVDKFGHQFRLQRLSGKTPFDGKERNFSAVPPSITIGLCDPDLLINRLQVVIVEQCNLNRAVRCEGRFTSARA